MKAVRISLELAIVPIRKFLIIFYIYIRLLFGREGFGAKPIPADKDTPEYHSAYKNLNYLKDYEDKFLANEGDPSYVPRFKMESESPVEQFYKRHMTTDNPIPQVIVVGVLRVLLTTCPNNAKNAGGIDLHSEWTSCLNFMMKNKAWFAEHNFKSKAFDKTAEYIKVKKQRKSS